MWPRISRTTNQQFSHCSRESVSTGINKSCLTDALDIALELEVYDEYSFVATVANNDYTRSSAAAGLVVDASSLNLDHLPAGCQDSTATEIECSIGTLAPGETQAFSFQLANAMMPGSTMLARLQPYGFYDVVGENNLAQLTVGQDGSGNTTWAVQTQNPSTTMGGSEPTANLDDVASGGAGVAWWLLVGGLLPQVLVRAMFAMLPPQTLRG